VTVECFDDIRIGRAVVEHEVDELADAVGETGNFTAPTAGGRAWNTGLVYYWIGGWSSGVGCGFSSGRFRSFIRFIVHSNFFRWAGISMAPALTYGKSVKIGVRH